VTLTFNHLTLNVRSTLHITCSNYVHNLSETGQFTAELLTI